MSVVQVRFVRRAIEERFGDLIDLSDLSSHVDEQRHQAFLSRGLAALASQIDHTCSDTIAAQRVFDGRDDRGLDAVAVVVHPTHPRIFLYQAKWSDAARASFGEDEVHKMLRGLDLILELQFSRFNRRFQPHVRDLERALDTGTPKITLVLALVRLDPLSTDIRQLLEEKIAEYNQVEEMVDYKIIHLKTFIELSSAMRPSRRLTLGFAWRALGRRPVPIGQCTAR